MKYSVVSGASQAPPAKDAIRRGQAVYTPLTLAVYDWWVLGFSNRLIWRCPTRELRQLYDANITANHLEVGVGTGYFLDRCRFPSAKPRLVLMDLNPSCLEAAAKRIARYSPRRLCRDVLEPIRDGGAGFDSIGVNYVLHCLPGDVKHKSLALEHLKALLNPGGVLFGSTLLSQGIYRNVAARALMGFYNRKGIFSNTGDSLADLQTHLSNRFDSTLVRTVGCAALFVARKASASS